MKKGRSTISLDCPIIVLSGDTTRSGIFESAESFSRKLLEGKWSQCKSRDTASNVSCTISNFFFITFSCSTFLVSVRVFASRFSAPCLAKFYMFGWYKWRRFKSHLYYFVLVNTWKCPRFQNKTVRDCNMDFIINLKLKI